MLCGASAALDSVPLADKSCTRGKMLFWGIFVAPAEGGEDVFDVDYFVQFDIGGWLPKQVALKPSIQSAMTLFRHAQAFDFASVELPDDF